jgi:hypothetical protein
MTSRGGDSSPLVVFAQQPRKPVAIESTLFLSQLSIKQPEEETQSNNVVLSSSESGSTVITESVSITENAKSYKDLW